MRYNPWQPGGAVGTALLEAGAEEAVSRRVLMGCADGFSYDALSMWVSVASLAVAVLAFWIGVRSLRIADKS